MDSTEVTQKEFTELMGFNPSGGLVCENCPVTDVSFYDGVLAANARSIRDGLDYYLRIQISEPKFRWQCHCIRWLRTF